VPHSIRRIAARDRPARVLVPARGGEMLAGLLAVVGEERGLRWGRGSVEREQRSRDTGVRPAPAIEQLRAVGHFVGEGMPEGALARGLGGPEELGRRELLERRGELGLGQIDHDAQQLRRHVASDHGRGLEHVLVARREPVDARRENGLDGLGQRDLLLRAGRRIRAALALQRAALDERANDLLDEEGIAAGLGLDPVAERGQRGVGSEPVVDQRSGVLRGEGRQRETLDPRGPRGPILGPRGREQQDPAVRRVRSQEGAGEDFQRRFARRVEPVQVLDPEHRELAARAGANQIAKRLEETPTARLGLHLRRSQRGIGRPE
jgi:hypothetical protein